MGTSLAPSFSYSPSAASTAARTSAARPAPKNSAGRPMRRPAIGSFSARLKSSAGRASEGEAPAGAGAHMAGSSRAQAWGERGGVGARGGRRQARAHGHGAAAGGAAGNAAAVPGVAHRGRAGVAPGGHGRIFIG